MQKLLYQVALVAMEAGRIALKYYGKGEFSLKSDSSPITQADLESNAFIMQSLQNLSSFEICLKKQFWSMKSVRDLDYYWLIDPLDGTKDFLATKWRVGQLILL